MKPKEKDLNLIIDKLCEGKGEEYKAFVKKMIISMSEGDKCCLLYTSDAADE